MSSLFAYTEDSSSCGTRLKGQLKNVSCDDCRLVRREPNPIYIIIMKRFSEQLKKKASGVKLHAAEKRDLRERVVAYMEYHPVASATSISTQTSATAVPATAEAFQILHISRWLVRGTGAALALFLVVIPVLAEQSVPGDSLYAVKVHVNEEVLSTLAFSSYEKVEWETRRLERRIAEAQTLARSGRLTPEVEALVVGAVEEHRRTASAELDKLRSVDAEQASFAEIALSTALDVQSVKLSSNNAASTTAGHSTAALARAVADSREAAEARSGSAAISYERLMAYIEQETTRTYELLDSIRASAAPEQVQAVERRLQDIERSLTSVVAAQAEVAAGETAPVVAVSIDVATTAASDATTTVVATTSEQVVTTEADVLSELRGTLKAIQKLIAYMTDIDLQATVNIETLVPVILTDEESKAEVEASRQHLRITVAQIERAVSLLESDSVQEKITTSLVTVERSLVASEEAERDKDWEAARAAIAEATAFVESMQRIFVLEEISLTNPVIPIEDNQATTSIADTATSSVAETGTSSEAVRTDEMAE